ncbi:vacuolar protein sorting-associated protein 52 [Chloropicon primus]|uniref:Vacuolar protein sorting-associated protein 52 n=2 Tax=Chloropicon primus TaxID=1764295 RepID=A0A5B8MNX8_9CHLO|nr:vacuolar protein sorting-associated protein 52 [Chloropicon primus]UPR00499.1 vacuolar protein sorting-associated protein 52 [Chloropicon primus]|eukprot:QDZ21285.1 vacuolar protein sorting-associated protein 52 [Chloropicon primus]
MEDFSVDLDLDLSDLDITSGDLNFAELSEQLARVGHHKLIADAFRRASKGRGDAKGPGNMKEQAKDLEVTLRQVEVESIEGYVNESGNLQELHSQILECDGVLDSMEDLLGRFQSDLSEISSEIKHIQKESLNLNLKLKNRRALHEKLSVFADNMQIPPSLIDVILDSEVSSAEYLTSLQLLHKKLNFLRTSKEAQSSLAFQDVAPELSKLENKAVSKVKTFLLEQFSILRKPKTNIQIQQQNRLLRLKGFVSFIKQHNQVAYKEIRTNYTETVGNILLNHFRVYLSHVSSLEKNMAGKSDVVGSSDGGSASGTASAQSTLSGFFNSMKLSALNQDRKTSRSSQDNGKCFDLGDRGDILSKVGESAVVPHVAESQGVRLPCEQIFRSINKLLLDSSSSEFIFSTEFFRDQKVFQETMNEVIALISDHLNGWVQDVSDPLGLFLMIRINYSHQLIMQRRRLPCLDSYLDNVNMILWPKLKLALDNQLQSLNNAQVSLVKQAKGRSMGGNGRFVIDSRLAKTVKGITTRFADLLLSLMILNRDFNQGQLERSLERLRSTMEDLLLSVAKGIKQAAAQGGSKPGVSSSASFLVSNYGGVTQTWRENSDQLSSEVSQGGNQYGEEMLKHFEDLYTSNVSLYVEEELKGHFGDMIKFVEKLEETLALEGSSGDMTSEKALAKKIMDHFRGAWQDAIQELNTLVHADFSGVSEALAKEVLKAALTQLLLYYTRFVEVLKQMSPDLLKESVTIPSIMYEIKKFR